MTGPAAEATGPAADRFGQLTYSSFDTGDGRRGGWQVKESRGLRPPEQEELTARIATRMDVGPTDRFLTPDQISALPRRLVYAPTAHGHGYWHTVPAGVDAAGRPGNVFAHVLLDRRPEAIDDLRPIDLWRSPDWLTPYNPDGVLAARLPGTARPRVLVPSGERALRFLRDPDHWRFGVLPGLLDAVAAALAGGPPVVLGVADPEHAAGWMSVVSRLTSPGTARRLGFSTLETADSVDVVVAAGAHVLAVRRGELEKLARRPGLVLIDEDEIVETGTLGGDPHLTTFGSRITPTPWSGLAQVLLDDADRTPELLAEMDAIALAVGDRNLPTAWPAAALVLLHPDELADGLQDALAAGLAGSPSVERAGDLGAHLQDGIHAALAGDAARVWSLVSAAPTWTDSDLSRLVARTYLARALTDPAWLTVQPSVPLPPLPATATSLVDPDVVVGAVLGLRTRALEPGADLAMLAAECLRMADLLFRAQPEPASTGWDAGATEAVTLLEAEVERLVMPCLTDRARARALRETVGPVCEATATGLLRPLLLAEAEGRRRDGFPLGQRLPWETLTWLVAPTAEQPTDATVGDALAAVERGDALVAELVVHSSRRAPAGGDGAWDRRALAVALVEAKEEFETDRVVHPVPPDLAASIRLTIGELGALTVRFGHLLPAEFWMPVLAAAPSSAELVRICRGLAPRAWDEDIRITPSTPVPALERLIRLRAAVAKSSWWTPLLRQDSVRRAAVVYQLAAWAGQALPEVDLAPEVIRHAQAAWVVAQTSGSARAALEASPAVLDRVLTGPDGAALVSLVEDQMEASRTVGLAALVAEGSPLADLDLVRRLAAARVDVDGSRAPVLEHAARRHVGKADDVAALIRNAVVSGRNVVAGLGAESPSARQVSVWEEFASTYLRAMSPKQGVLHATLGRLRRG